MATSNVAAIVATGGAVLIGLGAIVALGFLTNDLVGHGSSTDETLAIVAIILTILLFLIALYLAFLAFRAKGKGK